MLNIIEEELNRLGADVWAVEASGVHSAELFYIRRNLDTRRMKDTKKYLVRVYRDFEKDGKPMRGMSEVTFVPTQSREEIAEGLKGAYYAASFVENSFYPLPEKQAGGPETGGGFGGMTAEDAALAMSDALFREDHAEHAFINSAEIFAVKTDVRLITSGGTDVSYSMHEISGEFVAQCKEPEDVEIFRPFRYDTPDREELSAKVRMALRQAEDRAHAEKGLKTGVYNVILSDDCLAELMGYYTDRTSVGMVYPGYSSWKIGDEVQKQPVQGEELELTLRAQEPYSSEGIPMIDRSAVTGGRVRTLHGNARLSSYLGVEPTGEYRSVSCGNGTVPLAERKKEPCLYPVVFSDFQMDSFTGHFGGEIRLAYWFDGKTTRIVTGGSINGSIIDCSDRLLFSKERYRSLDYEGPFAVLLRGVSVAGAD